MEPMSYEMWDRTSSIFSYVKGLRKIFNSRKVPKAVSTAKELIAKMMGGEAPQLEKLLLTILSQAQEDEFWEKLDEVAINLCNQRNTWLDNYLYSPLIDLIDIIVVGRRSYDFDYDEHMSMANNTNSTGSSRPDINHYFEETLPLVFSRFKVLLLMFNFFTEGYSCMGKTCHHGISGFRIAVDTLVPASLDRQFSEPDIEASPQENPYLPPPRYTVRNTLGLDFLGPYFDNTKFFVGGLVVQAVHFTGLVDF